MFSQNREEEEILKYFGDFKGTFLSIGENDGETLSNVRQLALNGWCGVMVEPAPAAFAKLKKLYESNKKGCFYLYECAIGNKNGKATLYDSGSLLKTGDTSLVSTLNLSETTRFQKVLSYAEIEVKCFKWKTFLNRLYVKKFDFISIDCEGLDYDIISQMDLTDVKCICIEWNGDVKLKYRFFEYLNRFEYGKVDCNGSESVSRFDVIYESPENLIFAR